MNKIKEYGFVKNQACQPNLISFFDKATSILADGEAENTEVRPFAFSHGTASNELRKHPLETEFNLQSNCSWRWRIKGEEVSPSSTITLEEGLSPFLSVHPMGCIPLTWQSRGVVTSTALHKDSCLPKRN